MPTPTRSGLSVVIPAHNESESISETLAALARSLSQLDRPSEIIVVDDGSTDNTAVQAKNAPMTQGLNVRVLQHPTNSGYGRSLLTGIAAASHDAVLIVDADGTYPVDRIADLLTKFDQGFDMVVGARQGKYYFSSWGKRLLRFFFRVLAEYTCGRSIPDINSGFRVFYRKPVLAGRGSVSTGFSFTTTITLLFMLNNLWVAYVPVSYNKRVGKSKVRLVPDALRSLQIIFTAIAQFNPLKLYLLILISDLLGTLILIGLTLKVGGMGLMAGCLLIMTWNVLSLIMAIAILAVGIIKPAPDLSESLNRASRP